MARSIAAMIEELGANIESEAGKSVRSRVMAGCTRISSRSGSLDTATWMKDAIARLDRAAGGETAAAIMDKCGEKCARSNTSMIARAKARMKKASSLDAFLAAEQKKPIAGTSLERKGNVMYWTYMPRSFSPPRRCFCALMHGLPDDQTASPTYCQCSRAFVRTLWKEVLGRPVEVEILGTALTGSEECRFQISF